MVEAKTSMDEAIFFHTKNDINELIEDLPILAKNKINPGGTDELIDYVKAKYPQRDIQYRQIDLKMKSNKFLHSNKLPLFSWKKIQLIFFICDSKSFSSSI